MASSSNELTAEAVRSAVLDAGLEVYRVEPQAVRVAQRVRMHLMDSAVSITVGPGASVRLTVRAQQSDFPSDSADASFARVRDALMPTLAPRGYVEAHAQARAIHNPADESDVLDVWHELTFSKVVEDLEAAIAEVRWALELPKCIEP